MQSHRAVFSMLGLPQGPVRRTSWKSDWRSLANEERFVTPKMTQIRDFSGIFLEFLQFLRSKPPDQPQSILNAGFERSKTLGVTAKLSHQNKIVRPLSAAQSSRLLPNYQLVKKGADHLGIISNLE
ncbi:MAG: hypothetical protein N4A65_07550 [Cohaesibacter sp.]|jgi:hypothetical protein|nr:hypothetical protein [Cohaesibacter sp.]